MIFRDFLKELEGQKIGHVPATSGIHILVNVDSVMGAKCTLTRVEDDFIVLDFKKEGIFSSTKTLYVPISMVYCDFAEVK